VRLGGIYALKRIANNSKDDRATIAEILTAYVRGHAGWSRPPEGANPSDAARVELAELRVRAPDIQAAMTVLGRRAPAPGSTDQPLLLARTDLRRADLTDAHLKGTDLASAHLEGALLGGADLEQANLGGADLEQARLGGANLKQARLRGADLEGAFLRGADLEGADLGAHLEGADLRGAHLGGARATPATSWPNGFNWKDAKVHKEE
jgi:hypothetical protein